MTENAESVAPESDLTEIPTTVYFRALPVGAHFMFHPKGTTLCRKITAHRAVTLLDNGLTGYGFPVPLDEEVRQWVVQHNDGSTEVNA